MDAYSVPKESHKLLWEGILDNPLHAFFPNELKDATKLVQYTGTDEPQIPINWRFAESISAIKGFQAGMLNVLLKKKYGVDYQKVIINTDHAQLFIMSILLALVDPAGEKIKPGYTAQYEKYFPDADKFHAMYGSNFKAAATNIFKTKDGRFYHCHGSMDAAIVQEALGLDQNIVSPSFHAASDIYQEKVLQYTADEIDSLMNDKFRQAGTICWSTEEYKNSEHGKANAHIGLYEIHHISNPKQLPVWWTPVEGRTEASRPLFGLKVLDLTRVIAAPTVTRELAELGASVLRITSPNVTDTSHLAVDLGWGKWNAWLDLKKPEDRERLKELVLESDVVVDGYRPGVFEKYGFGKDAILGYFKDRERGVIYAHENCYGWNGPWSHRSGWQQISDASTGVSLEYGRAMGNDEAVTPVFPNSDYCTGAAGATGVLHALIERSEKGGSFVVDIALNYYSQWLVNSCSTYSPEIWDALWTKFDRYIFRHYDNMTITLGKLTAMLKSRNASIFNPRFFETRENKAIGVPVQTVKPILNFAEGLVQLGYNVGSRGNGVDKARWPEDLTTEIIV